MFGLSRRMAVLGVVVLATAGGAFALDCDFLVQYADVTTVSTTIDGEVSDDAPSPFQVLATRDGIELLVDVGEDDLVYLQFDRVSGGER